MNELDIQQILESQRNYFSSGATLPEKARLDALRRLEETLRRNEEPIYAALKADLGKGMFESYMCELGLVLDEIKWMRDTVNSLKFQEQMAKSEKEHIKRSLLETCHAVGEIHRALQSAVQGR